jgi:hypothetical protein
VLLVDRPSPEALAERVAGLLDGTPGAWEDLAVARGWASPPAPAELPPRVAVLAAEADASLAVPGLALPGLPYVRVLEHVQATARDLASEVEWLVVVAPGLRADRTLLDDLAPALSASRLGCVHGARSDSPLGSPLAVSARLMPQPIRWSPVDYVLVRAEIAAGLSDADVRDAGPDPRAALLWLAQQTVDRGWLLGRLDVRGLTPAVGRGPGVPARGAPGSTRAVARRGRAGRLPGARPADGDGPGRGRAV